MGLCLFKIVLSLKRLVYSIILFTFQPNISFGFFGGVKGKAGLTYRDKVHLKKKTQKSLHVFSNFVHTSEVFPVQLIKGSVTTKMSIEM